jgi:hypothetical protein
MKVKALGSMLRACDRRGGVRMPCRIAVKGAAVRLDGNDVAIATRYLRALVGAIHWSLRVRTVSVSGGRE